MSKRQLAKALAAERGITEGTARSAVYKWLRDDHAIGEENAIALARIFGVPADHFLSAEASESTAALLEVRATLMELRAQMNQILERELGIAQLVDKQMTLLEKQTLLLEAIEARVAPSDGSAAKRGQARRRRQ